MKRFALFLCFFIAMLSCQAQNYAFYVRTIANDFNPVLVNTNGTLKFQGSDSVLLEAFKDQTIYQFKKAFKNTNSASLERTFYVESNSLNTLKAILKANHIFEFGEYLGKVSSEDTFYPDDYGQTRAFNSGFNANHTNLDYINLPEAWYYTTGKPHVKIGISDGQVLIDDPEFEGKAIELPNASKTNTIHGTGVAATAAAKANNGYGIPGICSGCSIISNGHSNYQRILELHQAGAKIINCSWGFYNGKYSQTAQDLINKVYDNGRGSIIVAASGNESWDKHKGQIFEYPASYDHVISVAAVSHKYKSAIDSVYFKVKAKAWRADNIKDHIASKVQFKEDPNKNPNAPYHFIGRHTVVLNDSIDIVAPGNNIFKYGDYAVNKQWVYNSSDPKTSIATAHVTGTLGLMFSINECLTFEEAESILKLSSVNIDHIKANQFAKGKYGAGRLDTGAAVKLTHDLQNSYSMAYIENQKFNRWNFTVNAISKNVIIRNQEFTKNATLTLKTKNSITVKESVLLKPSGGHFILLKSDSNLTIEKDCLSKLNEPDDKD